MPEVDGMKVLEAIRVQDPSVPVMMLTAHGSERVAVAAMKAGAFDYLPKPSTPTSSSSPSARHRDAPPQASKTHAYARRPRLGRPIIAESPALRRVLDLARVAPQTT